MKMIIKTVSLILCLTILLASCSPSKTDKPLHQINTYLNENKFNECRQYISELKSEELSRINGSVCTLLKDKFNSVTESKGIDLNKLYGLSAYDNEYADICRSLWSIASLLTITPESLDFNDFIHIRFFAVASNFAQYREIYSLVENVNSNGYLKKIDTAMSAYESDGDRSGFEGAYSAAADYDYNKFNPQQYLVSDYRDAHNSTVKSLKSICNGFGADDSAVVGKAINDLEASLTDILRITDLINAIHTRLTSVFTALSTDKDLNAAFKTDIQESEREYSPGTGFDLDSVFGKTAGFIDETDIDDENGVSQSISKDEAFNLAVNAINKTKNRSGKISVLSTEKKNIQMTSFDTDTQINSALEITKNQINSILKKSNGTYKISVNFENGVGDSKNLTDFIPPEGKSAEYNPSIVESYTAVAGSGGYVITFVLKAAQTSKANPESPSNALINGFIFDKTEGISDFTTNYSPSSVMLMINTDGTLSKYQYSINGICNCKFVSNNSDESATATFSFDSKYMYEFTY